MAYYYKLGNIPHKRHTQFRKADGGLYSEQLFSTEGFSNDYSLMYHYYPPTQIIKTEPQVSVAPSVAEEKMLKHRSFEGFNIKPENDFLQSRKPVLVNHDFEPITGRVHQPPPVHQTFEANNFVVCSFCPRLFDYHPQAVPAPYNHSNIDSDEVIYYVDGDFMSRKNVTRGMITLHPAGIPHGPHPGAVEKSIGAKETKELAVMVDTFHPLMLTKEALDIENQNYVMSWAE